MAKLITMAQKELSRYEIIKRLLRKDINGTEAAEQMRLSVRQVRRLKTRVKKYGVRGVIHGQRSNPGNRRILEKKVQKIEKLVKENYPDFGPTLASEKLEENHRIKVGKEKLRQLMIGWGLWKPKPRKKHKEYRSWRPRKEHYGSMQQYDGCYHLWFEDRAPECCLLLAVDDATGKITQARFDNHEGVLPTFKFWKGYVEDKGKPVAVYVDKFSTYKINHSAAQDNRELITQFERTCKMLGIELITAHSPEAKGRVERMSKTLQDRLVKELRLHNISDILTANVFLEKEFIPTFNYRFAVVPVKHADLHRPLTEIDRERLPSIFSVHSARNVMNDFTVRFKNQYFQLDLIQPATVCRKDRLLIEERLDDTIVLKLRDKELSYTALPKRPEKEHKLKILALTTSRQTYRPPANHPWRRQILTNKFKVQPAC